MPFDITISRSPAGPITLSLSEGQLLFILGANGTGKSGLMHNLYLAHAAKARRISAHRQTWLDSNTINMSPLERRNSESHIQSVDHNADSRWRDVYSAARSTIAIFDLIDAENVRSRAISGAVDSGDIELAKTLSKTDAPIAIINELLRLSGIPIRISVQGGDQVIASKNGGAPYGIAQLSDGERNALLIAANVLTAKAGALVLIDEPERHLHRSIISPLLTLLFARRPDCAFIVSTHDILLPIDNPAARTLLIRGCTFAGDAASAWDADLISGDTEIDDGLKEDILGGRRKLLFVEGTTQSLDKPLYSLIFQNVSVIAKAGCRDVEHSVSAIRDAADLHWVQAFGIVDNDRRLPADIARLTVKGIYPISVYSVESIYYHPDIQRRLADRQETVTGANADERLADAKAAAIEAITPHKQRLSERVVERALREEVFRHLPKREDISTAAPINVTIDVVSAVAEELSHLQTALDSNDLVKLLARYPIRETAALAKIANRLGFQGREQYEAAVRKLLMDDAQALTFVRSLFGTLPTDIAA